MALTDAERIAGRLLLLIAAMDSAWVREGDFPGVVLLLERRHAFVSGGKLWITEEGRTTIRAALTKDTQ